MANETNETKAPTMEEVGRDGTAVAHGLVIGCGQVKRQAAFDALKRMHDAALLGTQVPGLVEEVRQAHASEAGATERMREAEAKVSALQARVITLTAERDAAQTLAEDNEALVRAWSDALGLGVGAGYNEAEVIRAERDALRAQVEKVRQMVRSTKYAMPIETRDVLLTTLSAPPAETKRASAEENPVLYVVELHVGDGEWEPAFLGTLTSTVREKVDVKDRGMGPTRVAEYVRSKPTEMKKPSRRAAWVAKLRLDALAAIAKHPPVIADDGAGTVSLVWHDAGQKPRSFAVTTEQMRWMLGEDDAPAETPAPERCEGCTAPAAAYDSEGAALCDTCMGAEAKK